MGQGNLSRQILEELLEEPVLQFDHKTQTQSGLKVSV